MSSYRGGRSDYDDVYERRTARRSPPRRAPAAVREYEDVDVRIRERDRSRERVDRTPAFLREDNRRTEAGALVLRSREIETVDRRRHASPSPPPQRIRPRYVQRSPSPHVHVDVDTRVIERRRPRSPTPEREREHEHEIRIVHREKERVPSPSPSPPPPPPEPEVIRGPTIEREVITHYRDIDHGVIRLRQPTPPPPPPPAPRPRVSERECELDINISHRDTEVDIRDRARSRSRPAPRAPSRAPSRPRPRFQDEDDLRIDIDHSHIHIDDRHSHSHQATRRRAHSEVRRPSYEDEANYITSKIDSRGRMGEAWHGATKDWTIVDVPPGTERVQMDGVGGGGAEVTWQRYNGVRRAKFVPEREGTVVSSGSASTSDRDLHAHSHSHDLSVEIVHNGKSRGRERSRSRGGEVVEEIRDRRISIRDGSKSVRKDNDMWTEITKDLVIREAIERCGYACEETEYFFYVMQYLAYEDVLELVELSDRIRRKRRDKDRYIDWERDAFRDDWDRKSRHHHSHHHYGGPRSSHWDKYDNERVRETEFSYDRVRY